MRKSNREIKDFNEIVNVLRRCDTIRMGINDGPYPYVVPLSFGFEITGGKIIIYIHGAREGKKHDLLSKDNKVCIEADICHRFVPTDNSITTEYESIIGYGIAEKANREDTIKGLNLLLEHCGYKDFQYSLNTLQFLTVYKITLDFITGKRRTV